MTKLISITTITLCVLACTTTGTEPDREVALCRNTCINAWRSCSHRETKGKTDCERNAGDAIKRKACSNYYHSRFRAMTCDTDREYCLENCGI